MPTDYTASATLRQSALSGQGLGLAAAQATPPYTQVAVRGLALAALAALGQAGENNQIQTEALLTMQAEPAAPPEGEAAERPA